MSVGSYPTPPGGDADKILYQILIYAKGLCSHTLYANLVVRFRWLLCVIVLTDSIFHVHLGFVLHLLPAT